MSDTTSTTLCVWVHGFEGDADTFGSYPAVFESTYGFESVSFVYESNEMIDDVVDKLHSLIERMYLYDVEGRRKVILIGHSCGGLVIGRYILKKMDESKLNLRGIALFDSPIRGIDRDKKNQHKQYLANIFKSNWKLALALAGILALLGAVAKDSVLSKMKEEQQRLDMLTDRCTFLTILFEKWEKEREEIIQMYEDRSKKIPVLNVYCAQSKMNYFNNCTLRANVKNYEFGSSVAILHPIIHTLLFSSSEDNLSKLLMIGDQQNALFEETKLWMTKVTAPE